MIEFRCCKCKAVFKVGDDEVDRQATCQWCGQAQTVPDPDVIVEPGSIPFRCSNCGVLLVVDEELADRQVRCSECDEVIIVVKGVGDVAQRVPGSPDPPPATRPPATKPLPAEAEGPGLQGAPPDDQEPPATKPLDEEPPATKPLDEEPPATKPLDEEPPATKPLDEEPPAKKPPAKKPPAREPPATKPLFTMVGQLMEFPCRKCGHTFRVSQELAGKKGKCQKCGAVNVVPGG